MHISDDGTPRVPPSTEPTTHPVTPTAAALAAPVPVTRIPERTKRLGSIMLAVLLLVAIPAIATSSTFVEVFLILAGAAFLLLLLAAGIAFLLVKESSRR